MPPSANRITVVLGVAVAGALTISLVAPVQSFALGLVSALSVALLSVPAWAARGLFLFPLFTRLAPDRLLEDGVRPKIIALLQEQPGLGITDVCHRLGIGWGTAVHHLTRLESAGLVHSQDAGRRRRFFLPGESATRRTAVCVLSSDLNRRLLDYVRSHPGASQTQLCAALSISAPLAHKYLARLMEHHLVTATRQWRTVQYYPAESVEAALHEYAQISGTQREEGLTHPA